VPGGLLRGVGIAAATAILAAGCRDGAEPPPTPTSDTPRVAQTPTNPAEALAFTIDLAGRFWSSRTELGSAWTTPRVVHYRNGATPLGIRCDLQNTDPHKYDDNSFYCSLDDTVYLNDDLMAGLFADLQAEGVEALVAHELGHRANHLAREEATTSINEENQADCDAGATLAYGVKTGDVRAVGAIINGSIQALQAGRTSKGDWWEPGAHGLPDQRFQAFFIGYDAVRDSHPGRETCWHEVGQAAPGPVTTVNGFTVPLETGATVKRASTGPESAVRVSLPEADGMTGDIWATSDIAAGATAKTLWADWLKAWFGSDAVTLRSDPLSPLAVVLQGHDVTFTFDDLFAVTHFGTSAQAISYYDQSSGTYGIFCVMVLPGGGAFEFAVAGPSDTEPDQTTRAAVNLGFYYLSRSALTSALLAKG